MSRSFDLNPTAAKEATNGWKRITEPGPVIGSFRAAWYEKNEKGTESVQFIFANDSGQEAGPLALYTHNSEGVELTSYKMLNAIMACAKVRKIGTTKGKVKLWDGTAEVEKDKDIYPQLTGARIGLVLQGEEYENRNQELKTRLIIAAPFEAATRKMANEVLSSSADAHDLDKFLLWFDKGHQVKPLKGAKPSRSLASAPATPGISAADFDDGLAF